MTAGKSKRPSRRPKSPLFHTQSGQVFVPAHRGSLPSCQDFVGGRTGEAGESWLRARGGHTGGPLDSAGRVEPSSQARRRVDRTVMRELTFLFGCDFRGKVRDTRAEMSVEEGGGMSCRGR